MLVYGGYYLVGLSIFFFLPRIHCTIPLADGYIICHSEWSDADIGKGEYIPLQITDLKAKVNSIPEEGLKQYLSTVPKFYKSRPAVFPDLDQTNSIEHYYSELRIMLQVMRQQCDRICQKSGKIRKLSKNIEEMEVFQKILGNGLKDRIYYLKGREEGRLKYYRIKELKKDEPLKNKLCLDVGGEINQKLWDSHVDRLSRILHNIPSFEHPATLDHYQEANAISMMLRDIILQTIYYMHSQKFITGDAVGKFVKRRKTLKVVASTRAYHYHHESARIFFPTNIYPGTLAIINELHSENDRMFDEFLNGRDKRYLSYLYLNEFKKRSKKYVNFIPDDLFENNKLFNTLEQNLSYLLEKSISNNKQENSEIQDTSYSQVQTLLQKMITQFQENSADENSREARIAGFFVLDFIKANYGLDIMKFDKGEKLEEKMQLMSSSFKLYEELKKIYLYIDKKIGDIYQHKGNQINGFGEEILMIYRFHNTIITKNEKLFSNPEMACYCQTVELKKIKEFNEQIINEHMEDNHYYFHP